MSNAFSREFLGETPTTKDKLTIFSVTLLLMAIIGYFNYAELSSMPLWKPILFLLMVLDIIAGAIANFTKSSQEYYKNNTKKRVQFILFHVVHIGLIYVAVGYFWFCLSVLAYVLAAAFVVNFTKTLKQQEINASIVTTIGFVLFYVVFPTPQILMWLPSVLLVKLVFGFAIKREI